MVSYAILVVGIIWLGLQVRLVSAACNLQKRQLSAPWTGPVVILGRGDRFETQHSVSILRLRSPKARLQRNPWTNGGKREEIENKETALAVSGGDRKLDLDPNAGPKFEGLVRALRKPDLESKGLGARTFAQSLRNQAPQLRFYLA